MAKTNLYALIKKVTKEAKKSEKYGTSLVGEHIIVASYKEMPLNKLEEMRFIINKIIKQKKEFIRVAKAQAGDINEPKKIQDNNKEKKIKNNSVEVINENEFIRPEE